jgi:hypothetical protein
VHIHEDFEEFLRLLGEEKAEFVVVGGYAVAFHGYVRHTDDMDLFFRNSPENIDRIRSALRRFGLPTTEQQASDFADPGSIIRLGIAPVRIEMINNITGLSFEEVWDRRVHGEYGETPVQFISRGDLLANKKASARAKDLADIDELGGNRLELIDVAEQQRRAVSAYHGGHISIGKLAEEMGMTVFQVRAWLAEHDVAQNNSFADADADNA